MAQIILRWWSRSAVSNFFVFQLYLGNDPIWPICFNGQFLDHMAGQLTASLWFALQLQRPRQRQVEATRQVPSQISRGERCWAAHSWRREWVVWTSVDKYDKYVLVKFDNMDTPNGRCFTGNSSRAKEKAVGAINEKDLDFENTTRPRSAWEDMEPAGGRARWDSWRWCLWTPPRACIVLKFVALSLSQKNHPLRL